MAEKNSEPDYRYLIDKHKSLAFNIALKITQNEQDAEEVVQDSFMKAFSGLKCFKHESQFSTWFYRIVYNTAISSIRSKKTWSVDIDTRINESIDNNQIENALKRLTDHDRKQLITEAMSKLGERDYTLLTLFYFQELRIKDIAKIVKQKPNYIKVLLQRARIKLYNLLSTPIKNELKELI